ncbi:MULTISPECIES: histidine kinase [Paenibacillus]|uniref:sensor histidine kinase n=1 Tax=Paenibacillus TaxID=44249 RepID=UPI00096E636F|nr:histidine kinase [Paenibacillus sp. FSL H8-0259]OMF31284.1 two-component sensor histidine kinase [Paenibacillus sp. FSL H8-0259]
MRLKNKLVLSYIVLITLPLTILGFGYYYASKDIMLKLARDNVSEIVLKNNQIINERLKIIQDNSLSLMVECELYQIFDEPSPAGGVQLLENNKKVTGILGRYFSQSADLYSTELVTQGFVYGSKSKNTYPPDYFYTSELYRRAAEGKGRIAWVPTYDYTRMHNLPELAGTDIDYRYMFSAVRQINPSCVRNDVIVRAEGASEKPVLVMNFKEDVYAGIFRDSIPIKGSVFMVASEDGTIISHQDKSRLGTVESAAWLKEVRREGSGTAYVTTGGQRMIACFAVSPVTNWLSVVLIPPGALTHDIADTILFFIITLGAPLLALSLLFAYLISARISSPVSKLLLAIKRVGGGDFNAQIKVESRDELGHVLMKFNSMNERVRSLIDENYVVKLRERETEILALNIQLNPHFLYNTLNIINWMAVHGEKEQVSHMLISLSRMLHYTTDNRRDQMLLREDLAWLQDYIVIMANRFEHRFRVDFDIQPELLEVNVPKLFLQPLLENAIIHGFRNMESGGLITIYGQQQGNTIRFCVEDNGSGIEPERMEQLLKEENANIGLKNVDKRIKLLYGNEYGIEIESVPEFGTRVKLVIPYPGPRE